MAIELNSNLQALRSEAEALGAALEPIAAEADSSSELDARVRAALAESDLCRAVVPAAFGGRSETVDPVAVCLVREALMAVCSHADSLFALQGIGSYAITAGGTDEQRAEWLPRVCLARDDRGSGSDRARVRART